MYSLTHSQPFEGYLGIPPLADATKPELGFPCFFKTIPPERIGLNGEYDHSGLAKRVDLALRQQFGSQLLDRLKITQRGRVVIFNGYVLSQEWLERFVGLALEVFGAATVETQGVVLIEQSQPERPLASVRMKFVGWKSLRDRLI